MTASDIWLIGCGDNRPGPGADEVGNKAGNLMRMATLGLSIPPGFVLGTAWCGRHQALTPQDWLEALAQVERVSGLVFGDTRRPLLVSVRSGAPVSMPGMMDTLLNIGLCDSTLPGLLRLSGNPRQAWDSYRRLVAGYGETVAGVAAGAFEAELLDVAQGRDARELNFAELRELTRRHLATFEREAGLPFPQDPQKQLGAAIRAVFDSWQSARAIEYRRIHDMPDAPGTAVTVQRMAFGNAGGTSGAGVGFTRNPATGEPRPWIDFLFNAQGEDVVGGRRGARGPEQLQAAAPELWAELLEVMRRLERGFGDMQDFEFTIERGLLLLLQARDGKRTPLAATRIALDLLEAGIIGRAEALRRCDSVDPAQLRLRIADSGDAAPLAHAVSAGIGIAAGEIALDAVRTAQRAAAGASIILVRDDADTSDIAALHQAQGLLTRRGARTSHAAVVARQLGKVCLVGCEDLRIDPVARRIRLGECTLDEGQPITLDANTGGIFAGELGSTWEEPGELLTRLQRLRVSS